jgi:soluble lytic murein transglycosylase-like protein
MKIVLKLLIMCLVCINLYTGVLFYRVALPVKIENVERILTTRLAEKFNISYNEARTFVSHGRYTNIDPILIATIADTESNNNPKAISRKGYKGRMQSSTNWFQYDSVETLNGIEEFRDWVKMYKGDMVKALASYNGGTRPPKESYEYARHILARYQNIKKEINI